MVSMSHPFRLLWWYTFKLLFGILLRYHLHYYDGREKGGTFYTIRKAMAQNIPIVNVF